MLSNKNNVLWLLIIVGLAHKRSYVVFSLGYYTFFRLPLYSLHFLSSVSSPRMLRVSFNFKFKFNNLSWHFHGFFCSHHTHVYAVAVSFLLLNKNKITKSTTDTLFNQTWFLGQGEALYWSLLYWGKKQSESC